VNGPRSPSEIASPRHGGLSGAARLMRAHRWLGGVLRPRPWDVVAVFVATAGTAAALANALWLQPGPHPAPMLAAKAAASLRAATANARVIPVEKPDSPAHANGRNATPPRDSIGDLITSSSKRLTAVQRALADYGYGPVKPTGEFTIETRVAIEKFERDRRLPVSGRVSDRLLRELSAVTGRSFEVR
jgi:Putative peptidoglycan binding domain